VLHESCALLFSLRLDPLGVPFLWAQGTLSGGNTSGVWTENSYILCRIRSRNTEALYFRLSALVFKFKMALKSFLGYNGVLSVGAPWFSDSANAYWRVGFQAPLCFCIITHFVSCLFFLLSFLFNPQEGGDISSETSVDFHYISLYPRR
jgi:hypothetical protein